MPNTREMRIEQVEDILAKWEFFYGQRAGRELWAEKPKDVQEKDIEAFNRDISFVRDFVRGVTIQKWIPVTERLPERKTMILVYGGNDMIWVNGVKKPMPSVHTGYMRGLDEGWFTWDEEKYIANVTHWMPLPEPPKGGE